MESLLVASIIAGCFAALGYFGRRWLEGHGKDQALHRQRQVLEIHKAMLDQKLSPKDLAELEKVLLGRARRPESIAEVKKSRLELAVARRSDDHPLTQAEMTHIAAMQLADANGELDVWVKRIEETVGVERSKDLREAQQHWEEFCEDQATLVSSKYKGGSIMPMIYFLERERLVRERIAQLKRVHTDEQNV